MQSNSPALRSPAKLARPEIQGAFERSRLFRRLDEASRRPVLWISGPAGSGKTTLAASWIDARRIRALWYQVDAADADLGTFFYYLGLAGRKADPGEERALPALTAEYLLDIPTFSRNFIEALCQQPGSPSLLVFDNCHLAGDEAPFFNALLEGLNRLPEGSSIVFLSCSDPPACFARLRANRQMEVIAGEELKLDAEEFRHLALREGLEDPGPEALAALHRRLDGWVAGLLMLVEAARVEESAPGELAEGEAGYLFEYFSGEVFDHLDDETRRFLLQTSVLPLLTPEYVDLLTGTSRGGEILEQLDHSSCFTERRAHPSHGYQYHPLFREYLMARAEKELPAQELAAIESRAARVLVGGGHPDEAAALFEHSRDWKGLAGLVLGEARLLIEQGRSRTLESWVRAFPPALLAERPWLQYWLGASLMPMKTEAAYTCFSDAFELFREGGDRDGSLLACAGAMDATLWSFSDFHRGQIWTRRLYELIPGPEALPGGDLGARIAASIYSLLALSDPGHRDLEAWCEKALEAADRHRATSAAMQIRYHALITGANRRDTGLVERTMATIHQARRSDAVSPFAQVLAGASEVEYLAYHGDFEACLRVAEASLETAVATGIRVLDSVLLGASIGVALHLGRYDLARRQLQSMEVRRPVFRPLDHSLFHFLSARLALCEGDPEKAAALAQLALEPTSEAGARYPEVVDHLILAEIAEKLGDLDEAAHQIGAARGQAEECQLYALLAACSLNEASIHFSRGEEVSGLAALRQAFESAPRFNWAYCVRRELLACLCARALRAGIATGFVEDLIGDCDLSPPPGAMELDAWPRPLRIHTLGTFELLHNGESIQPSRKAQRKPIELLELLLAMGGRGVPEGRLSTALWPDAEGDMSHGSFTTTLHRLRKLMGVKGAVELREGRVSLNPRYCWVDAWALEDLLDAAEAARHEAGAANEAADPEQVAHLVRRALELYRGPFLDGLDLEVWYVPLRERLRSKLLRGVEALGRDFERDARWEQAIECYRAALEIDPLLEPCHRRLISCLDAAGRRAEALAAYDRCRKALGSVRGSSPSSETEALHRRLLGTQEPVIRRQESR